MKVIEATTARDISRFIELPFSLYRNDPYFVPQLRKELRDQFSKKNPFFRHADVRYYLAEKNGSICGRVASIINHRHQAFQHEDAGFFGFFKSENDKNIDGTLLDAVAADLKLRGVKIMRGPMNFSANG